MNLYYNNKAARKISNNLLQHNHTKHVELDCHFIKEKLDTKIVALPGVLTHEVFGKVFFKSFDKLDINDIYATT